MGSIGINILADTSTLNIKAGETVHLLLKNAELLFRQLTHEKLLSETRIAGILGTVLDLVHSFDEVFLRDTQRFAELQSIQMIFLLIHHHHQIVTVLIIDHQLSVSVGDNATCRKFYLLEEGIGVGILLVVVAENLK